MPCTMPSRHPALIRTLVLAALLAWLGIGHAAPADEVRALINRGELPAALAAADKAVQAQPRDAALRFLRGVALMEMRRDDEAIQQFTQLTQEFPELPDPYNNLALLHARAGRLELARQALQRALLNDPNHRAARINLGQIHLLLAAQAWEQAASAPGADASLQRKLQALHAFLASEAIAGPAAGAPR